MLRCVRYSFMIVLTGIVCVWSAEKQESSRPSQHSVAEQSSVVRPSLKSKPSFHERTGIGIGRGPRINASYCVLCEGPRSVCQHPLMEMVKGGSSESEE